MIQVKVAFYSIGKGFIYTGVNGAGASEILHETPCHFRKRKFAYK